LRELKGETWKSLGQECLKVVVGAAASSAVKKYMRRSSNVLLTSSIMAASRWSASYRYQNETGLKWYPRKRAAVTR
jgi:hypothetical protein